ncbi:MAG: flagellin [Proteobacteria bacterium]|nr:flagellin [Pseudomonadota bacterium]
MVSVNTNYTALVALQSLTQTGKDLAEVQTHINTGLKVSSAADNGAVFAIAEGQRARVSSLGAVSDGIDRAKSTIDVGLSAGQAVGDILKQLKSQAVAAQATDLSSDQRAVLQTNFAALRDQINQIADAATFNGSNVVNGTNLTGGANAFKVQTSDQAGAASGHYKLDTVALKANNLLYASGETVANATGLTIGANDTVDFTITTGNTTTTLKVDINPADTIQQYVDRVASQTNGRISATYSETTGKITYQSNEQFTATYDDAATPNAGDDTGFLDGASGAAVGTQFGVVASPGAGTNQLTVSGFDFRLGIGGQALAGVTSALDISTAAGGLAASNAIDAAITALNSNLATLGAQSKALDTQKIFLGKLSDSITAGIGNLVDADLAKESAKLQALQVKQQLGAQALSIANQAPSIVLSFFK